MLASSVHGASLRVFLVRHGESEWNAIGRLQGHTEHVRLTALGIQQAAAVAEHLACEGVDVLATSDLVRASQTADAVARATGLPIVVDRRLREQYYGALDGSWLSDAAVAEIDWCDSAARVGGGESLEDVYQRVGDLLRDRIAVAHESRHRRIALVTHGETIRAAIAWLTARGSDEAPTKVPPNGSVTTVELFRGSAVNVSIEVPGQKLVFPGQMMRY